MRPTGISVICVILWKVVTIKVGTSGFGVGQPKYVQLFSCVEVQHTFYQPPQVSTLERWRAAAPPNFEFVLKAWQLITHDAKSPTYRRLKKKLSDAEKHEAGYFRPTEVVQAAWETTLACAQALRARTILFQCPASFKQTKENVSNLEKFFGSINRRIPAGGTVLSDSTALAGGSSRQKRKPSTATFTGGSAGDQFNFAWEPRGDWNPKVVSRICDDLKLSHAVDPFTTRSVTPDRIYFRLHGRNGWRYEYDEEELRELNAILAKTRSGPERVAGGFTENPGPYIFFNNARMTQDALRFQSIIDEAPN